MEVSQVCASKQNDWMKSLKMQTDRGCCIDHLNITSGVAEHDLIF